MIPAILEPGDGVVRIAMIRSMERRWCRVANRRGLSILLVSVVALLGAALPYLLHSRSLTPFSAWSFFSAYDEYSYLLAADTYVRGRLTNPTHEMWRHFESRAVNHLPTYQSMYPPGQGLFLALGQWLTGHPIAGVWISMALACGATCYLLQGWFPPRWALLGALLAALHGRMLLEWGGTYWGGSVAMLGGALVFGALRRIRTRPRVRDSFLFALGLALLANSRPFEGLVASIPALIVLAAWLVTGERFAPGIRLARVAAPILALLAATAAGMAYYNFRVSGSPWRLPYVTYLATHPDNKTFIWELSSSEPEQDASRSEDSSPSQAEPRPQAESTEWWIVAYNRLVWHSLWVVAASFKLAIQWAFYVGPVLSVPLLALPFGFGNRWSWLSLGTAGLTLAAVLTTSAGLPHYLAPVAPLIFVLVVQGSRSLATWRRSGRRIGRYWVPTLALLWPLQLTLLAILHPLWLKPLRWGEPRARLQAELEAMDGNQLVLVRYGPTHLFYQEWVYNKADIDGSKVVWAHELSTDSNRRLLDYFEDRRVWVVEPDRDPTVLVPYLPETKPSP
jgi:hypothetical protein